MKKEEIKIYVGIPCYGNSVSTGVVSAVTYAAKKPIIHNIQLSSFSILPRNFNMLLANALNSRKDGCTHFCLLHDDIEPEEFWLDKMADIMTEKNCDILSVVSPIKDNRGLTSTAIDEPLPGRVVGMDYAVTRLTMKEIMAKEETFTHEKLLVNTGLLLVDIRNDWVAKCAFDFKEGLEQDDKGRYQAVGISEDWLFSRKAREFGASIYATRGVKVHHVGQLKYTNYLPWGSLEKDEHGE